MISKSVNTACHKAQLESILTNVRFSALPQGFLCDNTNYNWCDWLLPSPYLLRNLSPTSPGWGCLCSGHKTGDGGRQDAQSRFCHGRVMAVSRRRPTLHHHEAQCFPSTRFWWGRPPALPACPVPQALKLCSFRSINRQLRSMF
jgi:hypothetical protein